MIEYSASASFVRASLSSIFDVARSEYLTIAEPARHLRPRAGQTLLFGIPIYL